MEKLMSDKMDSVMQAQKVLKIKKYLECFLKKRNVNKYEGRVYVFQMGDTYILKNDVAKGLYRIKNPVWYDSEDVAPLICIPFRMVDKTSLHPLCQKALWAITNVCSMIERGEMKSAYIDNIPGFLLSKKKDDVQKFVISKNPGYERNMREILMGGESVSDAGSVSSDIMDCLRDIEDIQNLQSDSGMSLFDKTMAEVGKPLKEVEIFLRIFEANGENANTTEKVCEYFVVLLVKSPISFSFRRAVLESVQMQHKGKDLYVDKRREIWNALAIHVRQELNARMDAQGKKRYRNESIRLTLNDCDIDWIKVPFEDSFTSLFSVHQCLQWMKCSFFNHHEGCKEINIEGFGRFYRYSNIWDGCVKNQYYEYDKEVEKAIAMNAVMEKEKKEKKRKANVSKKPKKGGNTSLLENNFEELLSEGQQPGASKETCSVVLPFVRGFRLVSNENQGSSGSMQEDETLKCGFPSCRLGMVVVLPVCVEKYMSFEEFQGHMKSFPASVVLSILKNTISFDSDLESSDCEEVEEFSGHDEVLTLSEFRNLVSGKEYVMNRPMLAEGDKSFYKYCERNIHNKKLERKEVAGCTKIVDMLRRFLRLGFGLSLTRAHGSDNYYNERVCMYGKFLEMEGGEYSKKECRNCYMDFISRFPLATHSDLCQSSMSYFGSVFDSCCFTGWDFRPDNLHYMIQLMVSDVMISLNFHGSVIAGAENGIGQTIIIRDGGGSYRRWFKHPDSSEKNMLGQIYQKKYGSGADFVLGKYKEYVNIGLYHDLLCLHHNFFSELKKTSEMGLMSDTCNITETLGGEKRLVHSVSNTMQRLYSTEFKAGADQQSNSCMTAIAWLIPRNTIGKDINLFKTTRENEKTKQRVNVEYQQVISGYLVICTNNVALPSRERFRAIVSVSRSLMSSAGTKTMEHSQADPVLNVMGSPDAVSFDKLQRSGGVPDGSVNSKVNSNQKCVQQAKPVFYTSMCTCMLTAFMQWTGCLGKLKTSAVTEAILSIFYNQLDLSKDLLNPEMYSAGEKARCLQISKARGVAMSLIVTSLQETLESGRKFQGHESAVERTALRFMLQNICPSVTPVIAADTIDHMFRLDFLILMQMLCLKFDVPYKEFGLCDVLSWLKNGNMNHCPKLKRWLDAKSGMLISKTTDEFGFRDKSSNLTKLKYGMYLTDAGGLQCSVPEYSSEVDFMVMNTVGQMLFRQYERHLSDYCQIDQSFAGEEIVRGMVCMNTNKQFAWPSVFGNFEDLPNFWMGAVSSVDQKEEFYRKLMLPPLRVVMVEVKKAALCVDIRWLLLVAGISGGLPCQSSKFLLNAHWIKYFFESCIPSYMMSTQKLFIGLPFPWMEHGSSFIEPQLNYGTENGGFHPARCMLKRPGLQMCLDNHLEILGTDVGCIGTGVVEDLGPAEMRYQLAEYLNIAERSIPTHLVPHYPIPCNIWIPVYLVSEDGNWLEGGDDPNYYGSLKYDATDHGKYILKYDGREYDVTWQSTGEYSEDIDILKNLTTQKKFANALDAEEEENRHVQCSFLNGRVLYEMRPLCLFFRPGVVLKIFPCKEFADHDTFFVGVLKKFDSDTSLYKVSTEFGIDFYLTPYEAEDYALKVGSKLWMRSSFVLKSYFSSDEKSEFEISMWKEHACPPGDEYFFKSHDLKELNDYWIECKLMIAREDLQKVYEENDFCGNGYCTVLLCMYQTGNEGEEGNKHFTNLSGKKRKKIRNTLINVHVQELSIHVSDEKKIFFYVQVDKIN